MNHIYCLRLNCHNPPPKCKTFLSPNKESETLLLFCPCSFLPWGLSMAPSHRSFLFVLVASFSFPTTVSSSQTKATALWYELAFLQRSCLTSWWRCDLLSRAKMSRGLLFPVHPCLSRFLSLLICLHELMLICFDMPGTWFKDLGLFVGSVKSHLVAVTQSFYTWPSRLPIKQAREFGDADAGLIRPDRARMLVSSCSVARKRG